MKELILLGFSRENWLIKKKENQGKISLRLKMFEIWRAIKLILEQENQLGGGN